MKNKSFRFLASMLGALWVIFLFWLGGFDFYERGFDLGFSVTVGTLAFVMAYVCPLWEINND